MNKSEIPNIAKECLAGVLDKAGSILYSSHETLKLGDVYLMGFNPGGTGGGAIEESVDSLLTNTDNSYLDEEWSNDSSNWKAGDAPLQKRVDWLFTSLELNTREVCASNLIFFQSKNANGIDYSLAEKCWPVHEAILNIIKPKLIIVFGNSVHSPFHYLKAKFGGEEKCIESGHGNWKIKGFNTQINGRAVYVAGVPHLSRYSPVGKKHVVDWLSKHL